VLGEKGNTKTKGEREGRKKKMQRRSLEKIKN
jgi:hypothetical protein